MPNLHFLSYGLGFEDVVLLIIRMGVGLFFAISGYHKLFNGARHAALVSTLKECGVPFLSFNQWFVPLVEFLGGMAVMAGILAPLAALGMLAILAVAIWTDGAKRLKEYAPIDKADLVCDCLYLPEVLYAFMLVAVVLAGPGKYNLTDLILAVWSG